MTDFEDFCAYARLTPDDDLITARDCYEAALHDAEESGIRADRMRGNSLFKLYINALALHYCDNRGMLPVSQAYAVFEFTERERNRMRLKLKYSRQNRGED